ncbi:MAG: tRNA (adenosine(37)-N6)-threonylcarbamoyltransferase complex ATPase subunit type 1 TsaE [Dehalococcoidia bacterium]|nr:tRNA (adenosine(37)-N6)-threonylcarbamoyltransferase complex ATPase subunit type 1 TsaE [Dehalococcoidia bacterium]
MLFISRSPQATQAIGRKLGEIMRPGDVILLIGELGAGKTCFVQGLARGLGVEENISSPSFVLLRQYVGRLPLYHVDLYRLEKLPEIADLGLDDYFYSEGVSVIEWANRALELLPAEHLLIELKIVSARQRRIALTPEGVRYTELVTQLSDMNISGFDK